MSERYSRPHTPPGPPPSQGPRSLSTRGPSTSTLSSKPLPTKSYDDHLYDKYDKLFSKPSSYHSSKPYSDDKYKSAPVRKISDKVPNSKFVGKSDVYDDMYKTRDVSYSGDRYSEKDHLYVSSYPDKGRYTEKYPTSSPYSEKFSGKKFADDYDSYPEKTSRYPRHENDAYYGSTVSSYDTYGSYDAYSSDRHGIGGYTVDKHGVGFGTYGDKYGGRGGMSGYGGEKLGGLSYGGDKLGRSGGSYGVDKQGRGGGAYPRDDKLGSLGYGDDKSGTRTRNYPDDDRRPYRDYSPPRTGRSPLQSISGSYGDYDRYSPPPRSPERQYLDRYVIGDSVVYGPPGQYPRDLRSASPHHARPPSPPSPQTSVSRSYSRYPATSPRRYTSSSRRSPALQPTIATQYRSPSPPRRMTSPRRPPSPPSRRPPSPRSPYLRGQTRNSREQSYEHTRSKERYGNKASISSTTRSPTRDSRSVTDRRGTDRSRGDRDKRKESERRVGSRERSHDAESAKRVRAERNSDYRNSSDVRGWGKDSHSSSSQAHQKDRLRDERRPHSPLGRSDRGDTARDRRREGSRDRDRSRRIEDRLGPSPATQTTRRSPLTRPRVSRRATSPRDKNRSRRPDDLRLWIESRKSEGGKRPLSPSRSRPLTKRVTRSSERSTLVKGSRLGDPKKRLGGYKTRRRTLPVKRNKILKKYQRLSVKRGPRSGGGTGGGRASNRSNRGSGGTRSEGKEGEGGGEEEHSKPGSTATIRRVIKKPKNVSQVNRLALKPRVIRKPVLKLLKDPKEADQSEEKPASQSSKGESSPNDEKPSSTTSETSKRPARSF